MARWHLYIAGLGAAAVAVALAAWQVAQSPGAALPAQTPPPAASLVSTEPVTITVEEGEGAEAIASKLKRAGVIRSALLFRVLAALEGVENRLGAGEYRLQKGMAAAQVLDLLRQGVTALGFVTIREGLRAEEVAALLEKAGVVPREEFLRAVAGDYRAEFDFLADLPAEATVEGYLFPDTYNFPQDATAAAVVRQMLANFDRRFGPTLRREAAQAGLSLHQAVTLASIVEREAHLPSERPLIASVFLLRLALDMQLAADPTVQYALTNDPASVASHGYWKRDLTVEDLQVSSPYNTYRNLGLPPGPIANPGLASLTAVARPTPTSYLYFVAKPDGSHAFAETLEEHQQNAWRYQAP